MSPLQTSENTALRRMFKAKSYPSLFLASLSLLFVLVSVRTGRANSRQALALATSTVSVHSSTGFCPFQTPEEWQQFLDRYADNEKWIATCEDSPCDPEYYNFVLSNVQQAFEQCAGFIARHPSIDRCTRNMRRFTPAWLRQHDGDSYGFMIDNRTYLKDQEAADKPAGMMRPPEAIVAALPDRAKVEEAARQSGLQYLTHDSALGGNRTFVLTVDPQGRYDQWMLLNLQTGKSTITEGTPMSIITVQKKDAVGNPLPQTRLHFRDYNIYRNKTGYRLVLHEESNGKCYSCHASGMRQLIPRRTPMLEARPGKGEVDYDGNPVTGNPPDFAFQRLMAFNRRIRSYGAPDWDGKVFPEDHGPALGKAQGCLDCHDGKTRGILTVSTSPAQLEQKLYKELSMPPDTDLPRWLERHEMKSPALSDAETLALKKAFGVHVMLTRDFESSRFPTLRDWFLETPCR